MITEKPTKFHKSFGNVEDEEISDGEILLIRTLLRDTAQQIISYRLKEIRVARKIKKLMDSLKPAKQLAKESQEFIDKSPLFALICQASTITPELGRRKFYARINDTVKRKSIKVQQEQLIAIFLLLLAGFGIVHHN